MYTGVCPFQRRPLTWNVNSFPLGKSYRLSFASQQRGSYLENGKPTLPRYMNQESGIGGRKRHQSQLPPPMRTWHYRFTGIEGPNDHRKLDNADAEEERTDMDVAR